MAIVKDKARAEFDAPRLGVRLERVAGVDGRWCSATTTRHENRSSDAGISCC
jgi:hypothetical protein